MYSIKYVGPEAAKELGFIHALSWKSAYKGIIPEKILQGITPEKREDYFEKALSAPWEEDAILTVNGSAAGLISIGKCRDEDKDSSWGEIWGIYLLPEYWNKGFGHKLFHWGIEELNNRGFTKISLWVLEDNKRAREFYEKNGFSFDGGIKEITLGTSLKEIRYTL